MECNKFYYKKKKGNNLYYNIKTVFFATKIFIYFPIPTIHG